MVPLTPQLLLSSSLSEVTDFVRENGKYGIQLLPGFEQFFLLLFADDVILVSSSPAGLQNQINNLEKASESLGLSVNLDKTKVMISRKGGHIAAGEKWFYYGSKIEIVSSYKYLGYTLTIKSQQSLRVKDTLAKLKVKY